MEKYMQLSEATVTKASDGGLQLGLSGRVKWQVLGRGLAPRLSIGTLQLSMRCSSIHFLPKRSLPVRGVGGFEREIAEPDAA